MKRQYTLNIFACVISLVLAALMLTAFFFSGNGDMEKRDASEGRMDTVISDKGNYTVLLLGRDDAAQLCDVIMLASVDLESGVLNILQIPRDTYFDCSDADCKRINCAPGMLGGTAEFSDALSDALGIGIDFYVSVNMSTVSQAVDALGGIEINVPSDMDYEDPSQKLSVHIPSGDQVLGGEQAVRFLRYRSGYATGDLGRMDAQKLFLNALIKKLGEVRDPYVLLKLFKIAVSSAQTNISERELVSLGLRLTSQRLTDVFYMTAPGAAVRSDISGAWYYILSANAMKELISERFGACDGYLFDKSKKFVDKERKSFYDIYNSHCDARIYSAYDIDNNQLIIK